VGGLEVAMNDALAVSLVNTLSETASEGEDAVWREAAGREDYGERLAVEEFHGEEVDRKAGGLFGGEEVEDFADMVGRNAAGEANFVAKAREHVRFGAPLRADGLQGNGLVQSQVASAVYLSHAAAAEKGFDSEAAGKHSAR